MYTDSCWTPKESAAKLNTGESSSYSARISNVCGPMIVDKLQLVELLT